MRHPFPAASRTFGTEAELGPGRAFFCWICSPLPRPWGKKAATNGPLRSNCSPCLRKSDRLLAALLLAASPVLARGAGPETSGQVRTLWENHHYGKEGPLAAANQVLAGTATTPPSDLAVQTELRISHHLGGITLGAIGTLQLQKTAGAGTSHQVWLNEGVVSGEAAGWQWSGGKKIVSWDVGYGFRPNDIVQQESRRSLVTTTLEGRPVLMAEHFNAQTAWSLVWVNPTHDHASTGANEPAWAARVYRRDGTVDWHGFARLGARTGASIGAAAAWVASDAVELHASWRGYRHTDVRINSVTGPALARTVPWQTGLSDKGLQALIGGTWTTENQFSFLIEAWWDASAPSNAQWATWKTRNLALPLALSNGAPASAVAGNLAWQANAFGAASSLQRSNLYARMSWQHDAWQATLDCLYSPADRGRMATATVAWQGDRVRLEGGLRINGGPADAVIRQLPVQREAYALAIWMF